MDDEETQAIADARESRELAFALVLALAGRLLEFMDEHEALGHGVMHESHELAGGSVAWRLSVNYGRGHDFVSIEGTPQWTAAGDRMFVSENEHAQLTRNAASQFACNVPQVWVRAALRDAVRVDR